MRSSVLNDAKTPALGPKDLVENGEHARHGRSLTRLASAFAVATKIMLKKRELPEMTREEANRFIVALRPGALLVWFLII